MILIPHSTLGWGKKAGHHSALHNIMNQSHKHSEDGCHVKSGDVYPGLNSYSRPHTRGESLMTFNSLQALLAFRMKFPPSNHIVALCMVATSKNWVEP